MLDFSKKKEDKKIKIDFTDKEKIDWEKLREAVNKDIQNN